MFRLVADLVVGAPYGGPDEHGEVYISFLGSSRGIIPKPSQIINARDIDPKLRTFGYSLSGGTDMDGNLYPGGWNQPRICLNPFD